MLTGSSKMAHSQNSSFIPAYGESSSQTQNYLLHDQKQSNKTLLTRLPKYRSFDKSGCWPDAELEK